MDDTTIRLTKLFKLRTDLDHHDSAAAAWAGLEPDTVYWLVGNRRSSLGGYIGQLRGTYTHRGCYSPNHKHYPNVPMRYLEETR